MRSASLPKVSFLCVLNSEVIILRALTNLVGSISASLFKSYLVSPQQPPNAKSGFQNNKIHNGRKNIAARRSTFIAITERIIDASVVLFSLVYSKPRPNLRFARLNLRSTSIRSVLSMYSIFLSAVCCLGLPSFFPKS